jgi:class 3 adenylate cyclase/tetratricopeptide (TPR) repeat protein
MDVADWLRTLGLEQYRATFLENDVDGRLLPNLTLEDLKDLGITSVGHRRRLLDAIAALRRDDSGGPSVAAAPAASPIPDAKAIVSERRPLSVMFCDLIGSTAMSARLDPEDMAEIIRTYHARVTAVIEQFNGFIVDYMGDGVLTYFGWPEARETDAERAVRAGLAIAAAVGTAPVCGENVQVRIGIATGLVVVGEPTGSGNARQQMAIGETPNIAARLQNLAAPNQVVIDAATRRQIGGLFTCEDLGTVELRGLQEPAPLWRVVSENRTVGHFEALRSGATPLVGREEEVALLGRRWEQAKAGSGRVVLISGESGLGKSRLAEALAERIEAAPQGQMRFFCSPHYQNSAFYPIIAQLERTAGFTRDDEESTRLARLQDVLGATQMPAEDIALIAQLHGLATDDHPVPPDLVPRFTKDKTFEALLKRVEGLARQRPLLVIFDDIHWIDPSSHELLDRLIERLAGWPVLLLIMFRPEFQPKWIEQPHVTLLTLRRLGRCDTAAMIAHVAGDSQMPDEAVVEIIERTDGVPLFVEELAKAVLEAGTQAQSALSAVPHPATLVPGTLHASLMARLDRLGPAAREVAQSAAAIGREFDYELLASIIDLPELQLCDALDRLTNAGLLFVRGTRPQASYLFKHALVQDAAYGSLLRSRRQGLHHRIVSALEDRFPVVAADRPARLAQHCMEAGLLDKAAGYWLKAGHQALARSAMTEAIAQLRTGLGVLASLPDSPPRQQQKLDMQMALTSALIAAKGYAAAGLDAICSETPTPAEETHRPEWLPLVRCTFHYSRAEYRSALPIAQHLEQLGLVKNDTGIQWLGLYLQGCIHLCLGEFVATRALLERCTDLPDPARHPIMLRSPHLHASMLGYLAVALAHLGFIDQARSRMHDALCGARRIQHTYALTLALNLAQWLNGLIRLPNDDYLLEIQTLMADHDYSSLRGLTQMSCGGSSIGHGQVQEGLNMLVQGLEDLRATGDCTGMSQRLVMLAVGHTKLGRPAEARVYFDEAKKFIVLTDERFGEAELLHRLPGDYLCSIGDQAGAEHHYQQAIAIAERQCAKLFQLKASTSLARLWRDQGKRTEARELLDPIYNSFTEGFDVQDLIDAKALLDELA